MGKFNDLLELMNTLILSTINDYMVKVSKASLADIRICIQNAQENTGFLQLKSQLQQDGLQ